MRKLSAAIAGFGLFLAGGALAQQAAEPVSVSIHRNPAKYPVPYGPLDEARVVEVLNRVHAYVDRTTPTGLMDRESGRAIGRVADAGLGTAIRKGDFSLTSYEWGVTYSGMLAAADATGDPRYAGYVRDRLNFLAEVSGHYRQMPGANAANVPVKQILFPAALDDSGAMAAAVIKMQRRGGASDLTPMIRHYLDYVSTKQFRLTDGTLARNRPFADTLWLDDMYMSIPAIAQMGALTGERRYFDDAVKQVLQFSKRMFQNDKGLYLHGWVQAMDPHPAIYWARANGWAILAMTELLDVLPQNHPGRAAVLKQYRAHAAGLARYQSGNGMWHQLLDRPDSYLETSATAMYAYSIARGINRGWLDAKAYGPMAILAWHAITTKVNKDGQVEDVCVGTGIGFDPAYYYYRPVNVLAAHGYGPVLLAGAEMVMLSRKHRYAGNGGLQLVVPGAGRE
ncbi:glycoside hydrolase family 88 protein [Sphingomonas sp.]|jgi:rhamnogalacturonyl hydrolase YesR|uniref:glycoside hydrolase family 88/105 protein n=1 Tax=Sphingomonas sp. TaxID=28214 RepID=UPI002ED8B4E2